MKALISVYDKTGIVEFGKQLAAAGMELISTGGTHSTLSNEGGLPVRQVSDVTGSPEILDGRVKTLHPAIHGGLLARRDLPDHLDQLKQHNIDPIDMVSGQPLSLSGDCQPSGCESGGSAGKHRHWRAHHAAGRRQESPHP